MWISITIAASPTTSLGATRGSIQLMRNALRLEELSEPLPVTVLTVAPLSPDLGVLGQTTLAGIDPGDGVPGRYLWTDR
jgi:hypothetical protein